MTIPPDTRAAGQTGHISDHNNIADVLNALQSAVNALPSISYGTVNLVNGTATVNNSLVTTGSVIIHARQSLSGTAGTITVSSIVSGVSFTLSSTSATEGSLIGYLIVNE
jgi:hypothetical protein